MAKSDRKPTDIYDIDFNAKYLIPMSRIDRPEREEEIVECEIREGYKWFEMGCYREGYRPKRFYKVYFEHLIKHGYAVKVENVVD